MSDQNKTVLLLIKKIKADIHKLETFLTMSDENIELSHIHDESIHVWHLNTNDIHTSFTGPSEYNEWDIKVIESVYDGYFITWPDKRKYPVPLNYSSKTKLVGGDILKLKIMSDGSLIYKLIWPASRTHIKWTITRDDGGKYIAISLEGKKYYLNQAAVTFYKAQTGDEVSIIVNTDGNPYAALETVLQ